MKNGVISEEAANNTPVLQRNNCRSTPSTQGAVGSL
jgi:hypothetical protein